ncbi:flavin reductase family protein [Actinocorallia sp. B10E7]|uniref:flavin reductase family protein n=1 Tax=Actinocorallia sp. B10E7 TaxID=3153558 RepID=UPI00325F3C00
MKSAGRFRLGMQRLAGGVCVIALRTDRGDRCGMTVTSVCSLTAEPPVMIVCVNRGSRLGRAISTADTFAVNVLGFDQRDVAEAFGGMIPAVRGADRFAYGTWSDDVTGVPLLREALASFVCHRGEVVGRSTHLLVFGQVIDVRVPVERRPPLVHFSRNFTGITGIPVPTNLGRDA